MAKISELKKQLTEAKIPFKTNHSKADLQALLDNPPPAPAIKEVGKDEIEIKISLTMFNGDKHKENIVIANASGCIMKSHVNDPTRLFEMINRGLIKEFGLNHVKFVTKKDKDKEVGTDDQE